MRALRGLVAGLAWLLATVLMLLAIVLGLTIVLLPVSLLLGSVAMRLYRLGLKLAMPRPADVSRAVRKEAGRWRRKARRAVKNPSDSSSGVLPGFGGKARTRLGRKGRSLQRRLNKKARRSSRALRSALPRR